MRQLGRALLDGLKRPPVSATIRPAGLCGDPNDRKGRGLDLSPPAILKFLLLGYSIVLHEIAHGYAALKFGDDTALRMGRITLNPIPHIDPIGSVIIPALGILTGGYVPIAWAKPVPVNPSRLEPRTLGDIVVSVAGVATNLAIAVGISILLGFEPIAPRGSALREVLVWTVITNIALAVFNLVPIPPLDGHHVVKHFLPTEVRAQYERVGFGGIIVLAVLAPQLWSIIGPPIVWIFEFLRDSLTVPIWKLFH